jgi:oligoribonuclease NrnB/cAMP/cGMP phosphodiesterase (DHH superfamily)
MLKTVSKIYVLYHHFCSDGSGAKYAAWKKFGDQATYLGVNYGQAMPEIEDGCEVYIADFSYPKAQLRALAARSSKLVVLDHHRTAQEDLEGEPYAIFDMNRSGAVIAWEYFHPGTPVPTLLQIIQDRDLWTWKMPKSKAFLNYLEVYGHDVETWDVIAEPQEAMYKIGEELENYKQSIIFQTTKEDKVLVRKWGKLRAGICNTTVLVSEVSHAIYKNYNVDFSMTYFIDKLGVVNLSFRSDNTRPDPTDVSVIAAEFGGGGHRCSAGARTTLYWLGHILKETPLD